MVKHVLLCGCGNIGFRHLQALAEMQSPAHVTIIEPFVGGHERITDFISKQPEKSGKTYLLLEAVPETAQKFDLVVIATNADARREAFTTIVENHDIDVVIFEKILFQSVKDIDDVENMLTQKNISGFVNCGRRGFDSYRALAAKLPATGKTDIVVEGNAFGLASNAVHFLDLLEFLNGSGITDIDLSALDAKAVESKRAGFFEIFGTLNATADNGATLSVTCKDASPMSISITLQNQDASLVIDELKGKQISGGQESDFEIKYVSGMPYLYDDALQNQAPGLTPYAASANQHRLYLRAMCQYLGLPSADETICPIS